MSSERSSSAVRNLRSIFETKGSDSSPDTRGRSTSGLTDKENSRPTSKVRASFVPVETPSVMASGEEGGLGHVIPGLKRDSSAGLRRASFTENDENGEALLQMKKTVSQEAERRERDSKVPEAIPEHAATSAAATPIMQPNTEQKGDAVEESPLAHKADKEPANPDKPTTAAEEDPSELQPAEPTNEAAVSGGEALPPVAEELRQTTQAPAKAAQEASVGRETADVLASAELASAAKASKEAKKQESKPANGKPAPISTKTAKKPSTSSAKSPASQPKTPSSAKASTSSKADAAGAAAQKEPSKKASRSSLTAPTAASVARAAGSDRSVSTSSKHSPPSKAKPREGTKPIDLPSRLTAPTAASRARHDVAPAPSTSSTVNGKTSTTSRPKPQTASTRPTPRSSLQPGQRPESRASQASKKPAAPADGSFLERMTRPTAASASKTHEKTEAKSSPRASKMAATVKSKVNGHAKKPAAAPKTSSRPGTAKSSTEKTASLHAAEGAQAQQMNGTHAAEHGAEGSADDGQTASSKPTPTTANEASKRDEAAGNETPVPQTNGVTAKDAALEATPAFGVEETIR